MYYSLHNHTDEGSNQRLIDTINRVEPLLNRGFQLGMAGVCITDHESVSAHLHAEEYVETQRKNEKLSEEERERWKKFKLLRGNEIYLCRNSLTQENFQKGKDAFWHFILIAKDAEGHKQLRELSTIAYKNSFVKNNMVRPFNRYVDLEKVIGKNPGHLFASSACLGSFIDHMILDGATNEELTGFIRKIESVFGNGNFFLELQPSYQTDQLIVNKKLIELSYLLGTPAIITTDSHMLSKDDLFLQRAFLNSKDGEREVDTFYKSAYMMGEEEIHQYLDKNIGADEVNRCLENTKLIGENVQEYSLKKPLRLPFMPLHTEERTTLPEELKNNKWFNIFLNSEEQSDRIFINRIVSFMEKGDEWFPRDFWFTDTSIERLSTELEYLWVSSESQKVKWTKYLLQMADYIEIIWENGNTIICPGRGSAVSETLNYILGKRK